MDSRIIVPARSKTRPKVLIEIDLVMQIYFISCSRPDMQPLSVTMEVIDDPPLAEIRSNVVVTLSERTRTETPSAHAQPCTPNVKLLIPLITLLKLTGAIGFAGLINPHLPLPLTKPLQLLPVVNSIPVAAL